MNYQRNIQGTAYFIYAKKKDYIICVKDNDTFPTKGTSTVRSSLTSALTNIASSDVDVINKSGNYELVDSDIEFFDTTLNKNLYWKEGKWLDSMGVEVE